MLPGCHSAEEVTDQFASQFKAVYYTSGGDSVVADDLLYCVSGNSILWMTVK